MNPIPAPSLSQLPVALFADGADLAGILALNRDPLIRGLTTNPTLMRKAGVADYEAFARQVLAEVHQKPISFEVFSDEFPEMRRQALKIAAWQDNVYVKIPISNTRGESSLPLVADLSAAGVKLNVTALLTLEQTAGVVQALAPATPAVISIFAGRIADTGRDPLPIMQAAVALAAARPKAEVLWASVREVYNIFQAAACGCHIVTVPHDILRKAHQMVGLGLERLSLETVKTFDADARAAGFQL